MILFTIVISTFYSVLILLFIKGFDHIKLFTSEAKILKTNFSIIIPFRNEVLNLPELLDSIIQLNYPNNKFEILMINDYSSDEFEPVINDFKLINKEINLILINNERKSNSPKKDAIDLGISRSNYEWIITTDADCKIPKNWLKIYDSFIQKESPKMVIAPVSFLVKNKFLDKFQNLDFLSLQGSTIGAFGLKKPFLCNGANLAYYKNAFIEVSGFTGNNNIASGDDIFLLEKMITNFPGKVKFLRSEEAIIITKPERNFSELFQQRIRWASKTSSYKNLFGKLVGLIVFISNIYLIVLFLFALINKVSWQHIGIFFLIKFNVDFILLYKTANFFKQQNALKSYLLSSILYPFFSFSVALLSFKNNYYWKGRRFKK